MYLLQVLYSFRRKCSSSKLIKLSPCYKIWQKWLRIDSSLLFFSCCLYWHQIRWLGDWLRSCWLAACRVLCALKIDVSTPLLCIVSFIQWLNVWDVTLRCGFLTLTNKWLLFEVRKLFVLFLYILEIICFIYILGFSL